MNEKTKNRNYLNQYQKEIKSGKVIVPEKIKRVMNILIDQYEEGLKNKKSKYVFDIDQAMRPIEFTERFCRQSKGEWAGQPIKLMTWQKAIQQAAYGFVLRKDPTKRKYNEVLILVGRKNGKSEQASALGLNALIEEPGAEVYSLATKRDQARIVFTESGHMVTQSPELAKYIRKRKTDLYCSFNFGSFQPLASESNKLDGLNTSFAIIDELHAVDGALYDVIKQSMTARKNPMLLEISTNGFTKAGSIFDSQYEYACGVLDGTIKDEHFLPFIYELDSEAEWLDEKCWIKANPGLGVIKDIDKLRDNVNKAKSDPRFRPTVLTKDFNLNANSSSAWLTYDQVHNEATFDIKDVSNTYAIGGCDLSATTDLTAATLLIRKPQDEQIYVLQKYFLPRARIDHIEATSSKEAPYQLWADKGWLHICEGTMVSYADVTAWFVEMQQKYKIDLWKLGYDRALAGYWADDMANTFGQSVMEKVAQGPFTWTAPMKELGAMLSDKKINYNRNPMLEWCLTNTGVKSTGTVESIQPIKIKQTMRIDGMVSLLNAYVIYVKYRDDYLNTI